jgi:hypothetical protein
MPLAVVVTASSGTGQSPGARRGGTVSLLNTSQSTTGQVKVAASGPFRLTTGAGASVGRDLVGKCRDESTQAFPRTNHSPQVPDQRSHQDSHSDAAGNAHLFTLSVKRFQLVITVASCMNVSVGATLP